MSTLGLAATALDDLPVDQARQVLLELAKVEGPTLALIGAEPGDEPVWVVDTLSEVGVGSQDDALKAYARSNDLDIIGPVEVRTDAGSKEGVWEVHMSVSSSPPTLMFSAPSMSEALGQMRASLQDMAGSCVLHIAEWAQLQAAGSLEDVSAESAPKTKTKLSPFVTWERISLSALPLASKVAQERADMSQRKVRRKFAFEQLLSPQGMGSQLVESTNTGWNLPVLTDDGVQIANHHDLIAALRLGLDTGDVRPWPNEVAHRFLVHQELRSAMRSRGFAELTDFDASKHVHLRTSLLEFSAEITGDKAQKVDKPKRQEKPQWPPTELAKLRVVIALGRARLAYEEEAEWESVGLRDAVECGGYLWVEIDGPTEKRKTKKSAKRTQ